VIARESVMRSLEHPARVARTHATSVEVPNETARMAGLRGG
jgi:hypothetical protein